ncbi:MAG: hypothetical protein HGA31_06460 [Candidatus Moranbacteria bacterium]|nr:hypothetical protein [Candidatus Moranbacteria bacterium]
MARVIDEGLLFDRGPSKLDLMLAQYDQEFGVRKVKFRVKDRHSAFNRPEWYEVEVLAVRRSQSDWELFQIDGVFRTDSGLMPISIRYHSGSRKGEAEILTEPRRRGYSDSKKSESLMIVIHQMIASYQRFHTGQEMSPEIFEKFEIAKRISRAENADELNAAIEDLK